MQFKVILEVPDELFQKLIISREEISEETIEGQNNFEDLEFQKIYIKDLIENLTNCSVLSINLAENHSIYKKRNSKG
ncbi:MAG: hypothetical protein HeimC3_00700 [Candidatus Heimdallarchaeota archaeon LC_3]|jgi:hypothetical protein|nr:MAG: hypothetical protein HeimC3_00700 [Candidatus Heimdallarchaeota archaeon LC_3]